MSMKVRLVIVTSKRILTRYFEVDNKRQAIGYIPKVLQEEGISDKVRRYEVIEVDENNRRIKRY